MQVWESWHFDLSVLGHHMAKGTELFGAYDDQLWLMPVILSATAILLWAFMFWRRRQSDRAAFAARTLMMHRRLSQQRIRR